MRQVCPLFTAHTVLTAIPILCWCSSLTRDVPFFVYSNSTCPSRTTFYLQHHLLPISYTRVFSIIFIEHLLYIKHGTMPETQKWNQNSTFKQLRIYKEEHRSNYNNVNAIKETIKYSRYTRKRNTQVGFGREAGEGVAHLRETRKEPLLCLGPGGERSRNCWSNKKRNNFE